MAHQLDLTDLDREEIEMHDEPARVRALMVHLETDYPSDIRLENSRGHYDEGYTYETTGGEFAVMTEDEADRAWDNALDSYLDECVLGELSGPLAQYFDRDAWKRDARHDGRGHSLSSYNGDEHDATDPETGDSFVIFRIN
jgi:hypothetical protein